MKTHKDLDAWKSAMKLASEVYKLTEKFPKSEIFGLTNQMRRAAISVPSNIAEGAARQTKKEFIQFLHIVLGSTAEIETQLILAEQIGYLSDSSAFEEKIQKVGKLVSGLIRYLRNCDQ